MFLFVIDHLNDESDVAFVEKLYKEYMPLFKKRAYKYYSDMNTCEDIAHDCIVDVIRYLDSFKKLPEDKLRVYMVACIENKIKHKLKKDAKEQTGKVANIANSFTLADETDVADEIETKCNYEILRQGFEKLSEREQSIISMKYDMEMKDELIANALCIEKNSVRMTVLRCVRKLTRAVRILEGETK